MTILLLFSLPPPLAATVTSTVLPGTISVKITAGVLSLVFLRSNCGSATTRGAQRVVGVVVAAAHAFVDGVVQAAGEAVPAHVHADFEEHVDDAGVLADRAVAGGAHLAVGQDLRDRVLGGRALLALVGARQVGDVVGRVVVADVLQGGGDGFDEVGLFDAWSWLGAVGCGQAGATLDGALLLVQGYADKVPPSILTGQALHHEYTPRHAHRARHLRPHRGPG